MEFWGKHPCSSPFSFLCVLLSRNRFKKKMRTLKSYQRRCTLGSCKIPSFLSFKQGFSASQLEFLLYCCCLWLGFSSVIGFLCFLYSASFSNTIFVFVLWSFIPDGCWDLPLICHLCFPKLRSATADRIEPKIVSWLPMNSLFCGFWDRNWPCCFIILSGVFAPFFWFLSHGLQMIRNLRVEVLIYYIFPATEQSVEDGTRCFCAFCCLFVC